jgi:hypothetical protein
MFKLVAAFLLGFYVGQNTDPKSVEGITKITRQLAVDSAKKMYSEVKSISDEVTSPPPSQEPPKPTKKGWW